MNRHVRKKKLNRLRKSRRSMRYTHGEVMEVLGVRSNSRISQWELGKRLPSLTNAIKLSILYKTLVDHLFYELRQDALKELASRIKRVESRKAQTNKEKPP